MKTSINKHQLYNMLYSGAITMKEYLKALKDISEKKDNTDQNI